MRYQYGLHFVSFYKHLINQSLTSFIFNKVLSLLLHLFLTSTNSSQVEASYVIEIRK